MKKLFFAIMAIAAITLVGCKDKKDEPQPSAPAGVQMVDLGLPSGTKWANMNVGATTPEGYGDYFAWGETKPKTNYRWDTYFDTKDKGRTFLKYYNEGGKTVLDPTDDAAYVNWGADWRMPTRAEQEELFKECAWTWTENNNDTGVKGFIVSSKTNSNFIFLPAAGFYNDNDLNRVDTTGFYLSSSLNDKESSQMYVLGFYSNKLRIYERGDRTYGQSVRAVYNKQ